MKDHLEKIKEQVLPRLLERVDPEAPPALNKEELTEEFRPIILEVLAELKAALGNDPARFARTVAKPIVVERLLRNRFENDDQLHAPQRHQVEQVRAQLLAVASADSVAASRFTMNGAEAWAGEALALQAAHYHRLLAESKERECKPDPE